MVRIAVIEDNVQESDILIGYIKEYMSLNGQECDIKVFPDALLFLFNYKPEFECVFMDIDLPNLNGLDGAKKLRQSDPIIPLVFVTSLARYATSGYSVGALDYLVKPFSYDQLANTMNNIILRQNCNSEEHIAVRNLDGYTKIPISSIFYVEVCKHRVIYHTDTGNVDVWGSMSTAEKNLPEDSFAKCGASWLVNLKCVKSVIGNTLLVGSDSLKISRAKKKGFIKSLHRYILGRKDSL